MRKPRTHVPGAIYHVMLRGNNGRYIFHEDQDKNVFFSHIEKSLLKCDTKIHAYCLMPNHIHLVAEVNETSISESMQRIICRYVCFFNKKYSRKGHLFQGRFKSILVDTDKYFLMLIRYIHQNPLRAHLTASLNDFWWTSHFDYIEQKSNSWLYKDKLRSFFYNKNKNWINQYNNFMSIIQTKEAIEELYKKKKGGTKKPKDDLATSNLYTAEPQSSSGKLSLEIILLFCEKEFKISKELLKEHSRKPEIILARTMAISLAYLTKTSSVKALAIYFKRNEDSLSRQINQTLLQNNIWLKNLKEKLCQFCKA